MRGGAPKEIPLFLTSKTEIAKLSKEEIAKLQFLQFFCNFNLLKTRISQPLGAKSHELVQN